MQKLAFTHSVFFLRRNVITAYHFLFQPCKILIRFFEPRSPPLYEIGLKRALSSQNCRIHQKYDVNYTICTKSFAVRDSRHFPELLPRDSTGQIKLLFYTDISIPPTNAKVGIMRCVFSTIHCNHVFPFIGD